MSDQHINIVKAIGQYADAYFALQQLQESTDLIPEGDQKTGCIGEYYGYRFLSVMHSDASLEYGTHSEKGWDIHVCSTSHDYKVQIKTVSEYAKKRQLSPIHHGWDQLFVIYVNKSFLPTGFWIIDDTSIVAEDEKRTGCKCPIPGNLKTGSPSIPFGDNRIDELLATLNVPIVT